MLDLVHQNAFERLDLQTDFLVQWSPDLTETCFVIELDQIDTLECIE